MLSNKLLLILCFILCSLPAVLMRDLSTVNELNYVAIAQTALKHGNLFVMGGPEFAFPYLPPLYLWLCMLAYSLAGEYAGSVLLAINVLAIIGILLTVCHYFARSLSKTGLNTAIVSIPSLPFLVSACFIVSPYLINAFFIVLSCALLCRRCSLVLDDPDNSQKRRQDLLIPLCMLLSCMTCGPLGLGLGPLVLLVILILKSGLRQWTAIFPWFFWGILLAGLAVWYLLSCFSSGVENTNTLFFETTLAYFHGDQGHVRSPLFYIWTYALISLPLGIAAAYAGFRIFKHEGRGCDPEFLFSFLIIPISLILASIFSSKSGYYVLCALPTLGCVLGKYLQVTGSRDRLLKLLLILGMLPFSGLFAVAYFLNEDFPLLNGTYVVCAFLFILLSTLLSVIRMMNSSALNGIATFGGGVLVMILTLGFAVPHLNPYISPLSAVYKARALAEASNVKRLCVIGIPKPWTLQLMAGNLEITPVNHDMMQKKNCLDAYRLIGRSALNEYKDLQDLKRSEGAFIFGDSVLLEPSHLNRPTKTWRRYFNK